eukprot:gene13353-4203_t
MAEEAGSSDLPDIQTRYKASMVLSGVGDALGYKNGRWEFNFVGSSIHDELNKLGGVNKLEIKPNDWKVSDDTVLNLATAESLVKKSDADDESLFAEIAAAYKWIVVRDMAGRAPGATTMNSCSQLRPQIPDGYRIPFNQRGGGCGAAMRAMCIGLRYPAVDDERCLEKLIKISIESGRMTHHHPTGYLGSLASALFTALAVKEVPVKKWGLKLMDLLPQALDYIRESGYFVNENIEAWEYFKTSWEKYLLLRGILDGQTEPKFPDKYGVAERDLFYKSLAFQNWGGSSGHDAPMIAYDALLASGSDWEKLCHHGMLHGGDNDSTGVIAGACFGAMYGFRGVPECNYKKVEYHDRLNSAGSELYSIACADKYI